jgi:hypothetical protein
MAKLEDTTVGQIFNFFIFVASLFITLNNLFDLRYKFSLSESGFAGNVSIIHDIFLLVASFAICYSAVETPYDVDSETNEEVQERIGKESLHTVTYFTLLLYSATSGIVKDPLLLFSTSFDMVNDYMSSGALQFHFQVNDLERTQLNDLGLTFIMLSNLSKVFLFLAALFYLVLLVLQSPPKVDFEMIKATLVPRAVLGTIFLVNIIIYLYNTFARNTRWHALDNAQTVIEIKINETGILTTSSFENTMGDFSMFFLLGVVAYTLVFYEHYEYGALTLLAAAIRNVDRADELVMDNWVFNFVFASFIAMSIVFVAGFIRYIYAMKIGEVDQFSKIPGNVFYKIGNIICIVALLFTIVSTQYDWVDIDFTPAEVNLDVALRMNNISIEIDAIVKGLGDIAIKLDPCSKRSISHPQIDGVTIPDDDNSLDALLQEAMQKIAEDQSFDTAVCVTQNSPYTFINTDQQKCAALRDEFSETEQKIRDDFAQKQVLQGLKDYDESKDSDNEFFVDQSCANAQCTALTVATSVGVVASFIPFVSGVSKAATMAARAAFKVFRLGRRVFKALPRMRRKKQKLKSLAKKVLSVASASRSKLQFTKDLALVMLPVIILAAAAMTVLMFKRAVKITDKEQKYTSILSNPKTMLPFKIIIGLYGPLFVSVVTFTISLTFIPLFLDKVLGKLPSEFLSGESTRNVGFMALQASYALSSLGSGLILLSAFSEMIRQGVDTTVTAYINNATKLVKTMIKGVRRLVFTGEDATPKEEGDGAFRRIYKRCYNFLLIIFEFNTPYFQPLFFCIPSMYFIIKGMKNSSEYIEFYQHPNSDSAKAVDEIGETLLNKERNEGIGIDFDDMRCGAVASLVLAILQSIPGGLDAITNKVKAFADQIEEAFGEAGNFISGLSDLVEYGSLKMEVEPMLPVGLANFLIFLLPMICVAAMFLLWLMSVLVDGFGDFTNIRALMRGERTDDSKRVYHGQVAGSIGMLVFYCSVINVIVHSLTASILTSMFNVDMPYIRISTEMGDKYYYTQLASLFTLIASVSIYVNVMIPVKTN